MGGVVVCGSLGCSNFAEATLEAKQALSRKEQIPHPKTRFGMTIRVGSS